MTIVTAPIGRVRGLAGDFTAALSAGIPFAAPPVGELRFRPRPSG